MVNDRKKDRRRRRIALVGAITVFAALGLVRGHGGEGTQDGRTLYSNGPMG